VTVDRGEVETTAPGRAEVVVVVPTTHAVPPDPLEEGRLKAIDPAGRQEAAAPPVEEEVPLVEEEVPLVEEEVPTKVPVGPKTDSASVSTESERATRTRIESDVGGTKCPTSTTTGTSSSSRQRTQITRSSGDLRCPPDSSTSSVLRVRYPPAIATTMDTFFAGVAKASSSILEKVPNAR
jgi:hypothetical protein